jgi:hypothetical protein
MSDIGKRYVRLIEKKCLLFLIALWFCGLLAHADTIPVRLDVQAAPGQDVTLSVPANGKVPLNILRNAPLKPGNYQIHVSNFVNDSGSIAVQLVDPAKPDKVDVTLQAAWDANTPLIIPLTLVAPDFYQGDKYSGTLIIAVEGLDPIIWKINLVRNAPPNGTLVLDRQAVTLGIMRPFPWWGQSQSQPITVNVREKTGKIALEGITARLESPLKAPPAGFDLSKNVAFSFNDQPISDFTRWSSAEKSGPNRSIPAYGQGTVGLSFVGLRPGEYDAVIRFQSNNSPNDDAQKLALTLQVRDHWLLALLVLLAAVILSFVSTKIVSSLRQKLDFMRRIEELKPAWLNDEPKLLPVVWAQAILRQSEDLSKRFWLTGEDQIEARLNQVKGTMAVLDRIRVLRNDIQNSTLRKYVKYRAIAKLNGIVSSIGSGFVDDSLVKDLDDSLTNLRQWLDENSRLKYYWRDFKMDIALLVSEVEPAFFPELYQPLSLAAKLDLPQDENAVIAIEDQYAKMKLLWERRTAPSEELDRLKAVQTKEEIFKQADQEAWNRLNKATLEIEMPSADDVNVLTAYTPAQFSIQPTNDESLAETYLFRHGLKFEWTFAAKIGKPRKKQIPESEKQPTPQTSKSKKQQTMKLTPVTEEPQVIQYFPKAGEVAISVEITWSGAPGKSIKLPGSAPLPVSASNDFKIFRGLEKVEVISFVTAAMAAILTGFTTFYTKNSGFGTTSDYLTLFAWGFGVDQTKNFLQNLQAYSK